MTRAQELNLIARYQGEQRRLALALRLLELDAELHDMLAGIAKAHKMPLSDLLSPSRTHMITHARHEFFFRALSETSKSSVVVGRICGRDHTAVLYGAVGWALAHGLPIPRGGNAHIYLRRKNRGASAHGA